MKLALDVFYNEQQDRARAAAILFQQWRDPSASQELIEETTGLQPYVSGEFYKRELPCIMPLVERARASSSLELIIVDGFVDLGPGHAGLGRHLYEALGAEIEVVGVAKNPFHDAPALAIHRGDSRRPLYVTTTGDLQAAADGIVAMHGDHRIPTLLSRVDALGRGAEPISPPPRGS